MHDPREVEAAHDASARIAKGSGIIRRIAEAGGADRFHRRTLTRRADNAFEYRLHHDSIRGQIAGAVGAATLRRHHHAPAQKLATRPPSREVSGRRYALHHAPLHRVEAGHWTDAWRVASDMTYLEAKCRELGTQEVEADVARTAERCRTRGEEALCRTPCSRPDAQGSQHGEHQQQHDEATIDPWLSLQVH